MPQATKPKPRRSFLRYRRNKIIDRGTTTPIELLQRRQVSGYKAGSQSDGHKIGLAFDPGGYAGIIGLAAANELHQRGLLDYIDAFYGLSVGGVNAAYAATRQFDEGFYTYLERMPGRFTKNLSFKVNLKVLRREVETNKNTRLKFGRLNKKTPIVLGITRLEDYEPIIMRSNEVGGRKEFIDAMMWSCHLPYVAGPPPLSKDGFHYLDGTIGWSSTVELARSDGCSEIISLSNHLRDKPPKKAKLFTWSGMAASVAAIKATDMLINKHDTEASMREIVMGSLDEGHYERLIKTKKELQNHFKAKLFYDGDALVERLYPVALEGVPDIMTSDKRRLATGKEAGSIGAKLALTEYL